MSVDSRPLITPVSKRSAATWMTRPSRRSIGILANFQIRPNPPPFELEVIEKNPINTTRLDDLLRNVNFDDVTNRPIPAIIDGKKGPSKKPINDKFFKKSQNNGWNEKYFLHEQHSDVVADVKSETHGCIDSSISANIDETLSMLHKINIDIDKILKERISEITDKEKIFVDELTSLRDDLFHLLLKENIEHVNNYEKQYQKLLRDFIEKLENKLAAHLNRLQEQMEEEKQKIFDKTNEHITQTTRKADQAKNHILRQLQIYAEKQRTIEMQNVRKFCSDKTNQTIGYEQLRTLNFQVYSTIGLKKDGQGCDNIPQRNQFIQTIHQAKAHQPSPPKRTVYLQSEVLQRTMNTNNRS